MLRTLFGDLAPRRVGGAPATPAPEAHADSGASATLHLDAAQVDVVVDASPAAAMRSHFAGSRAELAQATAMITLLDPSRLWAQQVMQALSQASSQALERLALRERGTLRTLAVIERTRVPRHGTAPLQVYHADIRATGLEQEEIANALAEGSHLTAVIVGAMPPHAVVTLLRSLLAATRHPEWRCPWLVFILPPGAQALRQRILDQDWPPQVHTAAMSESLASASGVWNAVLTAWEAASAANAGRASRAARAAGAALAARRSGATGAGELVPGGIDPAAFDSESGAFDLPGGLDDLPPTLHRDGVMRALGLVARTEGLLACGLVNLACGDLLASHVRGAERSIVPPHIPGLELRPGDMPLHDGSAADSALARHAAAICAARQAHVAAAAASGDEPAAADELLVTTGSRQIVLRAVAQAEALGLVAVMDRTQANLALLRFRLMEAEKHLI